MYVTSTPQPLFISMTQHIPNIEKLSVEELETLHKNLSKFIDAKKQSKERIRFTQYKARKDVHPATKL